MTTDAKLQRVIALILGAAASALQPDVARAAGLEEIVVTAQRRSEAIMSVPLAVQAFDADKIERNSTRDLTDVIRLIPGASPGRSNTTATRTFQIRGVSSYYGEPTIGYYLDEAAFSVPNRNYAPVVSVFDTERIEVLRGPQGTLYGLGSMGGTIRFITTDPDLQDYSARVRGGGSGTSGGDPNYFGDLAVNAPLVRDKLGLRLSGSYLHNGGYAESPSFPDDMNEDTTENYRAKLLWQAADNVRVKAAYQRVDSSDHWGRNLYSIDPPSYPVSTVRSRNENVQDIYTASVAVDTSFAAVELTGGYIDRENDGLIPLNGGVLTVDGVSDIATYELRLVSNTEGLVEWVVGAIYQDAESTESAFLQVPLVLPPGPPPRPVTFRDDTSVYGTQSWAGYGEIAFNLLDGRLKPLVGLRYFTDDRDFVNEDRTPPPFGAPRPRVSQAEETFDATSPRVNVSYKFTDDALVYVNVAKGFRSGTFNTNAGILAAASIGLTVDQAVDSDSLWSTEFGAKWMAYDRTLQVELAAYRFKWSDQQLNFDAGPARTQVIINAGDTVGHGVEYGLQWATPLEGLVLQATGNINATKFDDLKDPQNFVRTPSIANGKQVASVPKQNHSLLGSYSQPVFSEGWELVTDASYTYISATGDPGDSGSPPTVPGGRMGDTHHLLRARLGLQNDRWGAFLFGDNLLDDDGAILVSGSGITQYHPRTIGLELRAEF